jgi:hypothetical protein
MGKLDKQTFHDFIDNECRRRLFWHLAEGDPSWMHPLRPMERPHFKRSAITALGQRYEQRVYKAATTLGTVFAAHSSQGDIQPTQLEPHFLLTLPHGVSVLLEHEWEVPDSFIQSVTGIGVVQQVRQMRPDIMLAQPATAGTLELLPTGQQKIVAEGDTRLAITLIDIKHTSEHSVGKTHFVELLVYAHALSHFLAAHGLQSRYLVPTSGHGIFPFREPDDFINFSLTALYTLMVPLSWPDSHALYTRTVATIRELVANRPYDPDKVPVRIRTTCGRCDCIQDCISSLNQGGADRQHWDLRLLPYTAPSLAELLASQGHRTIADIAERLPAEVPGYDPLYAERPFLKLKAQALLQNRRIPATPEQLGGQHHFSAAIPLFNEMSIFFELANDPTQEVVFGTALRMEISCSPKASFAPYLHDWLLSFGALKDTYPDAASAKEAVYDISKVLNAKLIENIQLSPILEKAIRVWYYLDKTGKLSVKKEPFIKLTFQYTYTSDATTPDQEQSLAIDLLTTLVACISFCETTEQLVGELCPSRFKEGTFYKITPSLAFFYWSSEQLRVAQELLQRQIHAINQSPEQRARFENLLQWVAPAESGVQHAEQHQKFFDLRAFVEGTQGLPHILNTTWHELGQDLGTHPPNTHFWAPHFNQIDFGTWHAAINQSNTRQRQRLLQEIQDQLSHKVSTLAWILSATRKEAAAAVAQDRAVSTQAMGTADAFKHLHPLARFWYLYSKLNAAISKLSTADIRLAYPSKGIGKLAAAQAREVTVLEWEEEKITRVQFVLEGMSAHMNLKERDRVLLLPDSERAGSRLDCWEVAISAMHYDAATQSYCVEASADQNPPGYPENEPIYVYPTSGDSWSERLYKLLTRKDGQLGSSFLGWRLGFLWKLGPETSLEPPKSLEFSLAEVLAYAPTTLPQARLEGPLQTTAWPPPDPSQEEAIRLALGSSISCLQGPPGTGKSQTIAALIDACLEQRKGPLRILVTAFSYDAMAVLAQKLREQQNQQKMPTLAARTQAVFARASSREPIMENLPGQLEIYDLEVSSSQLVLNGNRLDRKKGKRLEDLLPERFILFANAHSLFQLAQIERGQLKFFKADFGFELIIVDEASQLPTDYILAALSLAYPRQLALQFTETPSWPSPSHEQLSSLALKDPLTPASTTQLVVVGDHFQLPPVQQVKPPCRLKNVVDSLFHYLVEGHKLQPYQLSINYRSTPQIVDYTRSLGFYRQLIAFRQQQPYPPLPKPPASLPQWVQNILQPDCAVSTLIHRRIGEKTTSFLEAALVAEVIAGFFQQLGIATAQSERQFYEEELGVVSPHNAQGRLIIQSIKNRIGPSSSLSSAELDRLLRQTVYSVEKFQGSDRTFIVASIGISAEDQLEAEEEFIYDLNRFNVLSSRAKQKMLLICSEAFLDYIPRDRDVMGYASRIRDFALEFCQQAMPVQAQNERGIGETLCWRWRL